MVHVEGDFNEATDVKSLRKTWHTLAVGAALEQEKIPSLRQKVSVWNKELKGKDAEATWWHCLAWPGAAYALYSPLGGNVTVDLAPDAIYEYAWWDPAHSK